MLSYDESLRILKETDALLEGHFILSSGLHRKQYIQCAKLLSHPKKAEAICYSLANKIKETYDEINIILSPAMGGIVIGYEIGRQLNTETIFSERVNGNFVLRRDFQIKKNSKVLIVEDVITTGKSAMECAVLIKKSQGVLVGCACIIDRTKKNDSFKFEIVSQMKFNIETFNENDLPADLKKIKPIKPGSRILSK